LDRWLDGTAAYTGSRELPGEDRGATVLVIEPDRPARLGRIPEAAPGENSVTSDFEVALTPDGAAAITGRSTVAGDQASGYRRSYEQLSSRRALLEQAFGRTWPAVRVESVETGPLARLEEPVTLRFRLSAPDFAQRDDGGLRVAPFGTPRGYAERWAALAVRRYPLLLGQPGELRFAYRISIPRGWQASDLPAPATGEDPHAAFEVRYRSEPDAVLVEASFRVKDGRVPVADYPAFRTFSAAADAAFARAFRVAPATQARESR
jgi:hypothetical protein